MTEHIMMLAAGWWSWMLPMLWQAAALAGMIWAADLLLERRGWPQVRYVLWLLVLARLVIPPSFALPTSLSARVLYSGGKAVAAAHSPELMPSDGLPLMAPVPDALPALPRATLSSKAWLMLGATGVSVFFLGWLLARLLRLRRLVRRAGEPPVPAHVAEAFAGQAASLRWRRPPRLVLTTSVHSAGIYGLFRPLVLLPESYCELSREQLGHVFAHEFAHLKRGDLGVNAIQSLLHIIYWFNPALWLAGRRLRHLREICCDAAVASLLRERTSEYGLTLMSAAARHSRVKAEPALGLLGLFENPAFLRRRIEYLARPAWKHRRLRWVTAAALAALVTLCIMPMAVLKAAPQTKQPEPISNRTADSPASEATAKESNPVQEGIGWQAARVGATRKEILAAFGPSEDSEKYGSNYRRHLGIDVFYAAGDTAVEVRFNPGFKDKLTSGIGIGSSMEEVFQAYGRPVDIKRVLTQSSGLFDSQVLYVLPFASKIIYEKPGVLFWFDESGGVTQFVVFSASQVSSQRNPAGTAAEAPASLPAAQAAGDINAKVARLDIEKAKREDVVAVFGEPAAYRWANKAFTKDNLPSAYVMIYPGLLNVEMINGQIEELRFGEGGPSDYVFGGGLRAGSSLEEALRVIGPPDKTVEGGEIGFEDGVLYKNSHFINGSGGSSVASYYARRSKGVRIFAFNDVVRAIYVTRKDRVSPWTAEQIKNRIVDRTDYPFVDDPAVRGKWVSVDFVKTIEEFRPREKQWGSSLFLKELTFQNGGTMAQTWYTWTKGLVISKEGQTASAYTIKTLNGKNYLFFEWKSGDYVYGHRKPYYYVLTRADAAN
jgi:beta-lactamase regulating signal transducer with metallopeptidase domain